MPIVFYMLWFRDFLFLFLIFIQFLTTVFLTPQSYQTDVHAFDMKDNIQEKASKMAEDVKDRA